jgi:probable HAF family extracellular repeat protein
VFHFDAMPAESFKFIFFFLAFTLVPINFAVAAKSSYSIKQIGELSVGMTHVVRSANEDGDIVGTFKRGRQAPGGATWSENEGQRDVKTRIKSDYSASVGINNNKQIVGSENTQTGMRAFRSLENGSSILYLDQLSDDTSSAAIAINSSAKVVGWSSGSSGIKAVTWNEFGKVESLPNLPGSNSCRALVINDGGDIAGACDFSSGSRAVLWKRSSGDATDLGQLPGDTWSIPTGINNKGDIVGNSGNQERHNAVLWQKNGKTIKNLGVLSGRVSSRALGINNAGDVVGYSEGGNSRDHAFIWTNKNGMIDLNELIPSGSIDES